MTIDDNDNNDDEIIVNEILNLSKFVPMFVVKHNSPIRSSSHVLLINQSRHSSPVPFLGGPPCGAVSSGETRPSKPSFLSQL